MAVEFKGTKDTVLAKIAGLLGAERLPLIPENDWEFICRQVDGFKDVYQKNSFYLESTIENKGYYNRNPEYNPRIGIHNILEKAYSNGKNSFYQLFDAIVNEQSFNLVSLLSNEYDNADYTDVDKFRKNPRMNKVINENFHKLIRYLNIFDLDIKIIDNKFRLIDCSGDTVFNPIIEINELDEYIRTFTRPKVRSAYNDTLDLYGMGKYGSCIGECRVVLEGFFFSIANPNTANVIDDNLDDFDAIKSKSNKWFNGIQEVSGDPKKLKNPSELITDNDNVYFPRFRSVYAFYRLLCTLGSHRANEVIDILNNEEATREDALMCIQTLRSILYFSLKKLGK